MHSACLYVTARRQASSNQHEKCGIRCPGSPAQYNENSHRIKLPLKLRFTINCGTYPLLCLYSNASQLLESRPQNPWLIDQQFDPRQNPSFH